MAKAFSGAVPLAGLLEASRQEKGLSFSALATLAGVDGGQACRICKGQFRTLSHNVVRICNVLGVRPPEEDLRSSPLKGDINSERLIAELLATWDHTAEGAERLVDLLSAIRRIRGVS